MRSDQIRARIEPNSDDRLLVSFCLFTLCSKTRVGNLGPFERSSNAYANSTGCYILASCAFSHIGNGTKAHHLFSKENVLPAKISGPGPECPVAQIHIVKKAHDTINPTAAATNNATVVDTLLASTTLPVPDKLSVVNTKLYDR